MTFEEFFKKKKISLQLLQQAEPALFAELEQHYEQMGEKSFDHTKKYWFNPLRRKYPAPPEVKVEKVIIENPIAEQTVADTLTEPAAPAANVGFKPRFNSGMAKKPSLEQPASTESKAEEKPATDEAPNPSLGFKPKFRAASPSKPTEENTEIKPDAPSEEPKASPALGFKPKFKAASPPKPVEESTETKPDTPAGEPKPAPALGFKPKFKAAAPPKPVEPEATEATEPLAENNTNEPASEAAPKPMGFKPRFNAKNIRPKDSE